MNMPKKTNIKIEAFRHRAETEMDPDSAEETWKVLEHAIHGIYNRNTSGLNFEILYRLVLAPSLIAEVDLFQEEGFFIIRCNCWVDYACHASV